MKKKPATPASVFDRVQVILASAQGFAARSVNTAQVVANWLIGREIVEEEQGGAKRAGYGEKMISSLAADLKANDWKGYGELTLNLCRQFYLTYPELPGGRILYALRNESDPKQIGYALRNQSGAPTMSASGEKVYAPRKQSRFVPRSSPVGHALRSQSPESLALIPQIIEATRAEEWKPGLLHPSLSWTHYRALMRLRSPHIRAFYEIESIQQNWRARELERQMQSLLFERLAKSRDKKGLMRLATKGHEVQQPADVFKDPLVIEFLGLPESHRLVESRLEEALISNLQQFLLELGKGFAFLARQQRLTLEGDHYYVDLVFYHTMLKCYVLVDLKTRKLTHQDIGQMQLYVNYYDEERRTTGDGPTLGLILCTDQNDTAVRYTLGPGQQKIFATRYQLHLPSEADLAAEIRRELAALTPASVTKARAKR